jgi:hypothetical protein
MSSESMTDLDKIRERIIGEYGRRYPDWTDTRVTQIVQDTLGGDLAVVHAKTSEGEADEICFVEPRGGVLIFSTTEELVRFLDERSKAPFLDNWRRSINLGIALVSLAATALLIFAAWSNRYDEVLSNLVTKNFAAIIGLPFSFIAAFVVVALFRQGESALDFEAFGLKMKGATGEIVLWLMCFISISGSISLLWKN